MGLAGWAEGGDALYGLVSAHPLLPAADLPADLPTVGVLMEASVPLFPMHRPNYHLIRSIPSSQLSWSLFCANTMTQNETIDYSPTAGEGASTLAVKADSPAEWTNTLKWVPLIGNYLNLMVQAGGYSATVEACVDFMAQDLERGMGSQFVGRRVGVKVKAKSS